ncbi:unnamed protein product, partial [Iphiclides podalirius]
METIEEPLTLNSSNENTKNNVDIIETPVDRTEADVCHKSNGVVDVYEAGPADESNVVTETVIIQESDEILEGSNEEAVVADDMEATVEVPSITMSNAITLNETLLGEAEPTIKLHEPDAEMEIDGLDRPVYQEVVVQSTEPMVEVSNTESCVEDTSDRTSPVPVNNAEASMVVINHEESSSNDKVRFKTEILIEKNDVNENNLNEKETNSDEQAANNILSELGQGIELSEALRSSDVTDNVENNNCSGRQEVFNKEELLDILQGKDGGSSSNQVSELIENSTIKPKLLEAQLALEQLTRLKNSKKKKSFERMPKQKKVEKKEDNKMDNIINVLVQDWEDEETIETDKSVKSIKETNSVFKSDELKEVQLAITCKDELIRTSIDSAASEDQNQKCKSGDEGQPQRRLGRIIKKKVIFDPDNPDTFTKGKSLSKNKETSHDKESPPIKKGKSEMSILRSKSKSPISKLQWKKPSPKNAKQNKRLSEVDKLLMDEGAVNMIYQLTPEAPKGKKNVKTKAEFIKKLQSSTPEGKEMKFRERKKDASKYEDGEAKRILGGKHRVSLSSSVKSPSVCEDFETHSADDSIIYRRHSSSSYSSTCMSPRRLSDVESGGGQTNVRSSQLSTEKAIKTTVGQAKNQGTESFMSDSINLSNTEMINRDDCLSIKEKLKSKLSLALNKRKREITKNDKAPKQKKVKEIDVPKVVVENEFKSVIVNIEQRLAEISVIKAPRYNVEVLKELEQALQYVDARKDISVTLLTSQCGTLCSKLDLRPILIDDEQRRAVNAFEIAESVRSLLSTLDQHSKLLCTGVWGACSGVSLALVARSDVALASESATFGAAPSRHGALAPGLGALLAHPRTTLPQALINDLVVFGRRISASEALQAGLLTRCLWPEHFNDQLRSIVKDIAAQPLQVTDCAYQACFFKLDKIVSLWDRWWRLVDSLAYHVWLKRCDIMCTCGYLPKNKALPIRIIY